MTVKAVALDFDGVVLQSVAIKTEVFRRLFADEPDHVEDIVALHERLGGISRMVKFDMIHADILKRPLNPERKADLARRFNELAFDAVMACPMVPGAEAFLKAWSARMPLFVVSGTPHDELVAIVTGRGFDRFFAEVHGSPATKPDILRGLLDRHGLKPAEMPYVGDATTDEDAAHAVGTPFVGVAADGRGPFTKGDPVVTDLFGLDTMLREQ